MKYIFWDASWWPSLSDSGLESFKNCEKDKKKFKVQ